MAWPKDDGRSAVLGRELAARGVMSSIASAASPGRACSTTRASPLLAPRPWVGFQFYAERVKAESDIKTMAVGLSSTRNKPGGFAEGRRSGGPAES